MSSSEYFREISSEARTFNKKAIEIICEKLIRDIYTTNEQLIISDAGEIMKILRNLRMFDHMIHLGDALLQTGRYSHTIKIEYAQALIYLGCLSAAIAFLEVVATDTSNSTEARDVISENLEARGLLGRAYKELYLKSRDNPSIHSSRFITTAITYYLEAYKIDKGIYTWQGINAAALLKMAREEVATIFPTAISIAEEVLKVIQQKNDSSQADAWDMATAAEACLVIEDKEEALRWLSGYARMPLTAFQLASTLRQFEEVWQLDLDSETGKLLLPILRAAILLREGGNVTLDPAQVKQHLDEEHIISESYKSRNPVNIQPDPQDNVKLEKVFGQDSFQSYNWLMSGIERCQAVALIGLERGKGIGTGFLLKGSALDKRMGDELILITNAHVISDDPKETGLRSHQAKIVFEVLDHEQEFSVGEIIWSSPSTKLDTTVVRFKKDEYERLKKLTKDIKIYPLSEYLPVARIANPDKIYIIGHPYGGILQFSIQDNILLDTEDPKLHYRTPTDGGSSGSPVFNAQWELVGLHHAGSKEMPCLNKKPGKYMANEGIWIESIKRELGKAIF